MRLSSVKSALLLLTLSACGGGGASFDFLSPPNLGASSDCTITSSLPSGTTPVKVSAISGTISNFSVGLSASTCVAIFTLNGSILPTLTGAVAIDSSTLNAGSNTLTATTGTSSKTWTIAKNNAPICGVQSPAVTGSQLSPGASLVLTGAGSDLDSDPLTFSWKLNNAAVASSVLNVFSGPSSSQATFTPALANIGSNTVTMTISDGVDTTTCNWDVAVSGSCAIASTTPAAPGPIRVSNVGTTSTLFQAVSTGGCNYVWKLNGATVAGATAASFPVLSSTLTPGNNTLEVDVANGSSSDTKTWTVVRNTPPACASQTPAPTGTVIGVGSNTTLTANASDANGDPIAIGWTVNGTSVGAEFVITNGTNTSQAIFTPTSSSAGTNNIKATLNDGYDQTACAWAVQVVPACQIATSNPSTSTAKISANPNASLTFLGTPNDASCNIVWTLNGAAISGATSPLISVLSSQLNAGPAVNTLTVTASNGFTSANRSWSITRNQAPTCASQTPGLSGNNVGSGGTITFSGTAGNADSDPLTYAWTYNGATASGSAFTLSSSGNTAQAIFSPSAPQIGNNQSVSVAINDGYDTATCSWNVNVLNSCTIASTTPIAPGPVKVPNIGTATTSFQASANTGCGYTWALNGATIGSATSNAYLLPSSTLNAGSNALQVSVTNGVSTDTKAWTVVKNTPPACGSQNPVAAGNSVGAGGSITFQMNATNTDNDSLSYAWTYNGSTPNPTYFTPTAFGNSAQMIFAPDNTFVGNNQSLGVSINDGYDTASCAWNLNVLNSCTISATIPSASSAVRVPYLSSATTTFQAPANAGCGYTWTLNGSVIGGATSGSYTVPSSALSPGNNTLLVSVSNGSSTDTKTWTVVRNTPPVCASQTPAAAGNNLAVGGSVTLTANATDGNADPLTYAWKDNGSTAGAQFAISGGGASSQAIFSPDATNVGANSVSAVISDGYDTTSCTWAVQVAPSCTIASSNPSTTTAKISAAPASTLNFVASPSDASCAISWALNGATLSGQTNPLVTVTSSTLSASPATNTLIATATNGYSTATRSWTIVKNQAPICGSQTPAAAGNNVSSSGTLTFNATAGNPDSDPLTYAWTYNGGATSPAAFALSSSGNSASAVFTPNATYVGNNQGVAVAINDGYDTASCAWNVNVLNTCTLSSLTPAAPSTVKVPNLGTATTNFSAAATTGCGYTWTLNGTTIGGATTGNYAIPSSTLSAGSNTLQVSITNGVSTDTKSWTVVKNTPPTCASQTPASGSSVGVGGNITLQANAGNADSDALTYAWTYNGAAVNASYFSTSYFGNAAQAVFSPDASYIGTNQTVAVAINDGYDTASCTWALNVQNSCTISGTTPAAPGPIRVAYNPAATNVFQASANPGCTYTWSLNGSAIGGATSSSYTAASSSLTPGNNSLQVSVTNGSSTDSKTWTVTRNTPPVCASQTPAASGNAMGVGNSKTFVANGTDGNSDPLTFTWAMNGVTAGAQFAITPGSGTSQAIFTPDATSVGTDNLTATINDGYDTTTCAWAVQVLPACSIASSTPAGTTSKMSATPSASQSFVASPNDSSCNLSWTMNGSTIGGATSPLVNIASSTLTAAPATNTLVATASNGYTSATRTWVISQNQAPTCASQSPATTGSSVGVGGTLTYQATAGNLDSDPLSYAWSYNGSPASAAVFTTSSTGNTAQAIFAPASGNVGNSQAVSLTINDGYDSATCGWSTNVLNACVIASTAPTTTGTTKVAFASSATTNFSASANPGCAYTWTLNGANISGATAATYALPSTSLAGGNNTLQVTVGNGTSSDSKTWSIIKNSPPICSGQTPSSTGSVVAVGASLNLTANGVDANSDPLTFNWFDNGAAVGSEFVITPGAGSSVAAMTADNALVGSNSIRADIFDGLDTSSCSWTVNVRAPCQITTTSPATATYRMPFAASASQSFIASSNDSSCALSWKLNGATIAGATSALYNLSSSQLTAGPATNMLIATATDGYTTANYSWTITRNQPPTCASQTPVAAGNSVGVGGNITFVATAGNPDTDSLTYSWLYNGTSANASAFATSSSGNSGQAIFTPTASYVGNGQAVGVTISDGYDNASCSWTVNVVNSCSISSAFPSTATYKVAAAGATSTSFGGIPSDSTCAATWTLNGTSIGSGALISVLSSQLTAGPASNTLIETLNNGVTTPTTRSWTVTKNRAPTCSAQTPALPAAALNYTSTRNFTATGADADTDALSGFTWTFNGSPSASLFNPTSSAGATATSTFKPTFSQVGTGQNVSVNFTDGYDPGVCSWSFDVINPNTVSITSCNPAGNPIVVYSTGTNSTQTLQVVAANALGNGYTWYQNGSVLNGVTSSSYAVSSSGLSPGNYTYRGVASDSQGNTAFCDYNVKINAKPAISAATPALVQTYKMNYGSTMGFSVTATDANSDTLAYTWTLDGGANAALPSGSFSTTFSPNYTPSYIGTHTISVTVSDGYESVSQSWTLEVNLFSAACNTLYNSNSSGGQICTLVGVPGMGDTAIPTVDQTLVRVKPAYIIDDGSGNWIFSDQLNHTINFYNRSGAAITRWGITTAAGAMNVIVGNGANGLTIDSTYNKSFKLDTPMGIAYDSATKNLFIADYTNNRVAMIDNTGIAATVVGTTTGAIIGNAAPGNTDGSLGTSATCGAPTDVHVVNWSGSRWLYVSCYSTNSIKRLDINPASGTYLKIYTVVGRLNAANATFAGTADGTLGNAGDATTTGPWALADDGNGNIYWDEWSGFRARMAATGGTATTFFGGNAYATNAFTISASDVATTLTTGTTAAQAVATGASPTKVVLIGSGTVATAGCSYYRVQIENVGSIPVAAAGATTVTMTGAGAGNFYSDAGCTATIAGGTLTVGAGLSDTYFYYKNAAAATVTLTAASAGLTSGTQSVTTTAASTATKLVVNMASPHLYFTCTPVQIQMQNAANVVSTYTSARTIRLSHTAIGNFYTTSTCTGTPTYDFTIPLGATEVVAYYVSTVVAPANQTVSLFGNAATNSINPTTTANVSIGGITLRQTRGLAVATSAGAVSGFFVSAYDQHRDIFVNNTASATTIGGTAVAGYTAAVVLGTGTGGYNTDGTGNVTRIFTGYGLSLNPAQTKLLVPDYDNNRVRDLDLTIANGQIMTDLGAGRLRAGNLGDSPIAATAMYLNGPDEIVMDSTNRKLYVSDSQNSRIRRVDMLTGYVDTMVGKGFGGATVEQEDPTNAFMAYPRGLALMSNGGNNFLVYADQQQNTSANSNCQIRAMNLTPNIGNPAAGSLFSTTINPYKVATLAGDYTLGCNPMGAVAPNTALGTATNVKLYNPEGITTDGTNLIIADYNDHCILKMTPNGQLTNLVGTCGTLGTLDGSTNIATIRYPTAVVIDPNYAADGNFFFADAIDLSPTKVRYVNFRTTSVTIGSATVPAATSPYGTVQTLWTVSPSGNSSGRIMGLAAFGPQLCMAGGWPGNGNLGSHNVTCYDRSSGLGPVSLRVGSNENTSPPIRAGAPLAPTDQEGINATAALVSSPYGLSFDSAGNLYISERNNHIVRMVRRWW
jgi:hypothetical protein